MRDFALAARTPTGRESENYAAAALSAFEYCSQTVDQFRTLVAIAATILRAPPTSHDARVSRQTMLQLLLDTAEHYQRGAENDRALFEVLVLDARNIHGTDMRADEALKLLGERRPIGAHRFEPFVDNLLTAVRQNSQAGIAFLTAFLGAANRRHEKALVVPLELQFERAVESEARALAIAAHIVTFIERPIEVRQVMAAPPEL